MAINTPIGHSTSASALEERRGVATIVGLLLPKGAPLLVVFLMKRNCLLNLVELCISSEGQGVEGSVQYTLSATVKQSNS